MLRYSFRQSTAVVILTLVLFSLAQPSITHAAGGPIAPVSRICVIKRISDGFQSIASRPIPDSAFDQPFNNQALINYCSNISSACQKPGVQCTVIEIKDLPNNLGDKFATQPCITPASAEDLGSLISKLFSWSLSILGIAVFSVITYNGFQWLTAAGDPGKISAARGHMWNAVLGAILLLSSYVILNTINPDLVKNSTNLPPVGSPCP